MATITTNLVTLGLETYRVNLPRTVTTNTVALRLHTYPINQVAQNLIEDIYKLSPGTLIELFELDATGILDSAGNPGSVYYFHSGKNELNMDISWQGNVYSAFPVEASGFELTTSGQLPKPNIKVANVDGAIAALNRGYGDLVEAKVSRKRTLIKYLDAINFAAGNPLADPNQFFPDDVYYVNRKVSENRIFVEYELASVIDVAGVKLPRRQIVQNVCPWIYRGSECGYPNNATGSITFSSNPSASDTITINGIVFTFVAAGATGNQINIAASLDLTLDNMISVLNISVEANVALATYTEDGEAVLTITYDTSEEAGNTFTLAASVATISATTLRGGTGDKYWDVNDDSVALASQDVCGKKLSSCKLRFGEFNVLPYGGFPGAGLF